MQLPEIVTAFPLFVGRAYVVVLALLVFCIAAILPLVVLFDWLGI